MTTSSSTRSVARVALGQFAVSRDWQENADTVVRLMRDAAAGGAALLVLPEGILARDIADPDIVLTSAQPLDGRFMQQVLAASHGSDLTVMTCIHVPNGRGRVFNVLVTVRDGAIIGSYRKLHLYDAFAAQESVNVEPGDEIPPLVEVAGLKVGTMTCYDLRFPELARRLAVDGAEVIVVPAAWVRGLGKEAHWEVLATARALENTCYLVAVGECGERNIGASMVIDPLGVAIARAGEAPALVFADIDPARIAHARAVLPVLANRRFARPELAAPAAATTAAA
ncbi:putative amidohydrolase [Chelatococcus caeni]|uniref:Putative amidohydrolase n=1 Tax=Chelatococcus caeni TaxID=1348468 RepID=A0A840BYH8_9HYPH|nr:MULTISPECIES: deaminated glutathione amidase [Chelatococcus]ALA20513.1 hydrolase [Chelatococcus sp. CO-6]MBB4018591.1 putative amidohydrolase [Chelatococcus caeni]